MSSVQGPNQGLNFPLRLMFTEESYKPAPLENKLHYLIARDQPAASINKLVVDKGVSLDAQDPRYRLTPLAVAVMANNEALVADFLKRGANPLPRDRRNFTPLHYARILNNPRMEKLLVDAARARKAALPRLDELDRMLQSTRVRQEQHVANRFQRGKLIARSPLGFQLDTGIRFCDGVLATSDDLIDFWLSTDSMEPRFDLEGTNEFYQKALDRYRSKPRHLNYEVDRYKQIKIRASSDTPAFAIVGIHGGQMALPEDGENLEHRIHELTSEKVGNLVSLISTGFPNCFLETVYQDGIPLHILVSLKPIEKDEEHHFDFGPGHRHKFTDQDEPIEFEAYFAKNSPRKLYDQLQKIDFIKGRGVDIEALLTRKGMTTRLRYLFTTPFSLLTLCLDYPQYIDQILDLCADPEAMELLEIAEEHRDMVIALLSSLNAIYSTPDLRKGVISFIRQFKERNDLPNIIRMLHTLSNKIDTVQDLDSWNVLKVDLLEKSQALDALADWLRGEPNESRVLYHLKSQDKEYRDSLLLDLGTQVHAKYHSREKDLLRIRADIALFQWQKGQTSRDELVKALLRLSPEESNALWSRKEEHFRLTKTPEQYAGIRDLFVTVLPKLRGIKKTSSESSSSSAASKPDSKVDTD